MGVLAVVAVSACSPAREPHPSAPDSSPSPATEPSILFDYSDWRFQPGETLREGGNGHGSHEQVVETPGLEDAFSLYVQCYGEMTFDVEYQGDGVVGGPFSPDCDGILNRRQVFLDPATPVESLRFVVRGEGDWAFAVLDRDLDVQPTDDDSSRIDITTWVLESGDTLVQSVTGGGADDVTIDVSEIGSDVVVWAQCVGDDVVVDVIYGDDAASEVFTPVCDGTVKREQVHVDPALPLDEVRVVVAGVGDWAVGIVSNEETEASS